MVAPPMLGRPSRSRAGPARARAAGGAGTTRPARPFSRPARSEAGRPDQAGDDRLVGAIGLAEGRVTVRG
jgi:hypothetical protein